MTIFFDFEIKFAGQDVWADFDEFKKSLFFEIKDFFAQRMMPLKIEIDKQESELEEGTCCVMIHIMQTPARISIHGYSEYTFKRIEACFSVEDFEYLNKRLAAIDQSRNN